MSKVKINKTLLKNVSFPESGQAFIWDKDLTGFGLRLNPSGRASYIFQGRVGKSTRRVSIGSVDSGLSPEVARKLAAEIALDFHRGIDPSSTEGINIGESLTLRNAIDDYLSHRQLKDSTRIDVIRAMKTFDNWLNKAINKIKPFDIEKKYAELLKVSPTRGSLSMRYLRAIINDANTRFESKYGSKLILENPVGHLSKLRMWKRPVRKRTVIDDSQLKSVLDCILDGFPQIRDGEAMQGCLLFMLFTGVRPIEVTNLKWSDVNLHERSFTILEPKNNSVHMLPISNFLYKYLKAKNKDNSDYVFGDINGGKLGDLRPALSDLKNKLGIKLVPTDFRRTFITNGEKLKFSVYTLKALLNHSITNDVTAGYIISTVEDLRLPIQAIEDRIMLFRSGEK